MSKDRDRDKDRGKSNPDNVVPFIRDKKTRAIVKDQFDNPPANKVKESLDRINKQMAELRQMAERQAGLDAYEAKAGYYPTGDGDDIGSQAIVVEPPASTLPRPEELEREYRRKQDEMRKQRKNRNRTVARSYSLHGKGEKPRK